MVSQASQILALQALLASGHDNMDEGDMGSYSQMPTDSQLKAIFDILKEKRVDEIFATQESQELVNMSESQMVAMKLIIRVGHDGMTPNDSLGLTSLTVRLRP